MRSLTVIVAAAVLAGAVGADAQERSPAERQTLADLAYVLGRSHALRQACAGPADQYWRTRMQRLIDTEAPDAAFDGRLETAFNTGFAAAQAAFPRCNAAARREQVRAAGRGRALAATLTGTVADDDPTR